MSTNEFLREPRRRIGNVIRPVSPDEMPAHVFARKWRVDGRTVVNDESIHVEFFWAHDGRGIAEMAPLGTAHEIGHMEDLESIPGAMIGARDNHAKWVGELDAWAIARAKDETRHSFLEGTFILDALNSYRRALNVSEDDWILACEMVQSWNAEPERLREYVPLEPDPNDEPRRGCFGEELPNSNENGNEGDSNENGNEGDSNENGNEYGHDGPGNYARDRWLHSAEGIKVTREGSAALLRTLQAMGWATTNFPPLTLALLKGGR